MQARARWDQSWHERPLEEASSFNPAFCGEMIFRAAAEYSRTREQPFDLALAFLVLPMVLHKPTRDQLPRRASTMFGAWTAEHNALLAGLPDRTSRLLPISREALLFLLQHDVLQISDGGLMPGSRPIRITAAPAFATDETSAMRRSAALLGRWFANQRQTAVVMQGFGVTL